MSEENPNIENMSNVALQEFIANCEQGKAFVPEEKLTQWQYATTLASARRLRECGRIESADAKEKKCQRLYETLVKEGKGWL